MHIISSEGDTATRNLFRIAQYLAKPLTWSFITLVRNIGYTQLIISEGNLTSQTIGNYSKFETGFLKDSKNDHYYYKTKEKCRIKSSDKTWEYISYIDDCIISNDKKDERFPSKKYEPLVFIKTDSKFIKDHNDIFNTNISAYIASSIANERYLKLLREKNFVDSPQKNGSIPHDGLIENDKDIRPKCIPNKYTKPTNIGLNFYCFTYYSEKYGSPPKSVDVASLPTIGE